MLCYLRSTCFCWFFGRIEDTKKSFQNQLTYKAVNWMISVSYKLTDLPIVRQDKNKIAALWGCLHAAAQPKNKLLLPLVMEDQVFSPAYACVRQTKTEKAFRFIGCTLNNKSYILTICTTRQQENCRLIRLLACSCLQLKDKLLLQLVIKSVHFKKPVARVS